MGTIATQLNNLLTSTGEERIEYNVYDKDGNFLDTHSENVLIEVPSFAIPLKNDLTVEYLRPVKKVIREVNLKRLNIVNNDPISNYGGFRMDFTHPTSNPTTRAEVEENSKALSGDYLIKGLTTNTFTGSGDLDIPNVAVNNDSQYHKVRVGNKYVLGFSYYIENTITNLQDLDYYFVITASITESDNNIYQYRFDENKWEDTNGVFTRHYKFIKNTNKDVWNNFTVQLEAIENLADENVSLTFDIYELTYRTSAAASGHTAYYIDNYFIDQIWDESNKFIAERVSSASTTLTGIHETTDLLLSNELGSSLFDGGFDGNFYTRKNGSSSTFSLDELITQEVLNDYRQFIKRYEGTFYNTNPEPIPIALHNKLWLNFYNDGESISGYIDSMKYDVKRNEYSIVLHIPNQDDDFASTFSIKYE